MLHGAEDLHGHPVYWEEMGAFLRRVVGERVLAALLTGIPGSE